MLATTMESMTLPLWIAAGVALLAWLAFLWFVSFANRPNRPEPVSAGLELGGDAPPAIVAMLTHDWKPQPVGATATLIDLAARGIIHFEPMAEGGFQIRVPEQPPPPNLLTYEIQVLDLVRSRASGGIVPCRALQVRHQSWTLASGPSFQSLTTNWFKQFDKAVAADARRRGLARSRFSKSATVLVRVAAAIPAILVGIAVGFTPSDSDSSTCSTCTQVSFNPVGIVIVGIFAWIFFMVVFKLINDERDTPEGLAEAGRWLGLRGNLKNDRVFGEQHVDAVTVWDRLLAYGVALGVAHVAADDVPISKESKNDAWSTESGHWRLVHIDYPKYLPPGYGGSTSTTLIRAVFGMVISGFILVWGVPYIIGFTTGVSDATGMTISPADTVLKLISAFVAMAALLLLVRALAMLWFAGNDLVATREIQGLVLRSYSHESNNQKWWEAAVDDGTSDRVRAWRGGGRLPLELQEGNRVNATISRHLCTFKSSEVLHPNPEPSPPPASHST